MTAFAFYMNKNMGEIGQDYLMVRLKDIKQEFTSLDEIDIIAQSATLDKIAIGFLNQKGFDYFIERYAHQFKWIRFFRCDAVKDWTALASLKNLQFMDWQGNRRINQFWDMGHNTALKGLCIQDFPKITTIAGIEKAPALEAFEFGNAIWNRAKMNEWQYLYQSQLKYLGFGGLDMGNDLTFLHHLPELKIFDFAPKILPTEYIAWICANFPQLEGYSLCAYREIIGGNGKPYVIVCGKRKPSFYKESNEAKMVKYQQKFDDLIQQYQGVPFNQIA